MKKYRNTRTALAALAAAVATHAAMFQIAALALTSGTGFKVLFRLPDGYLVSTEVYETHTAALSEFKKRVARNEMAATLN